MWNHAWDPIVSESMSDPVTRADFQTAMNGLQAQMGGLQGQMGGLEGRIGGLEGRIGGLEGRMDGLEHRMDILGSRTDRLTIEQIRMREEMTAKFATKDDFQHVRDDIERLRHIVLDAMEKGRAYFDKALSHGAILVDHESRLTRLERKPV